MCFSASTRRQGPLPRAGAATALDLILAALYSPDVLNNAVEVFNMHKKLERLKRPRHVRI